MNDKKKYYMRGLGFGILITAIVLMIVHRNDAMTDAKVKKRAEELGYVLKTEVSGAPSQTINIDAIKDKLNETPGPSPVVTVTFTPTPTEEPTPTPAATPEPTGKASVTSTVTPTLTPSPTQKVSQKPTSTPKPTGIIFATATPSATPSPLPTAKPKPTAVATATPSPTATPTSTPTPTPFMIPTPTPGGQNVRVATIVVEPGMPSYQICSLVVNAGIVEDGDALSKYASANGLEGNFQIGIFTLSSDMTFDEILTILTGVPPEYW